MNAPTPVTSPSDQTAQPGGQSGARAAALWMIGLIALILVVVYLLLLPGMREKSSFALLDQVTIKLRENQRRDDKGQVQPVLRTNPVTGKEVPFVTYVAYIGEPSDEHPDLAGRRAFVALGDLCGQQPELGMRVFRAGLAAPMDASGYRRRLVANEMLFYLRDVRDLDPNNPNLALTMDDLYKVAQASNGDQFQTGAGRRAADQLELLLGFPAEFPDRVTAVDFDAKGKSVTARVVYLAPAEYNGQKFLQPFFEQGRDCLLLIDTLKKENFAWDATTRRFLYSGPKPLPPDAAPPATGANTNALDNLGRGAPEAPIPAPKTPPPPDGDAPPAPAAHPAP